MLFKSWVTYNIYEYTAYYIPARYFILWDISVCPKKDLIFLQIFQH